MANLLGLRVSATARSVRIIVIFVLMIFTGRFVQAQVAGSIAGTIKDSTGGVIPGASVTVTNTALETQLTTTSDARGFYLFPDLPVGRYDLLVTLQGFKPMKRLGLTVSTDSRLQVDTTLEVGEQTETVTVSAGTVQVDTLSTQIGEVVSGKTMTTLSLNGRSYTDLLAIQPGVIPMTTTLPDAIFAAGAVGAIAPSGQLNPGNLSISGQRESSNGFLVNGSDVVERMMGTTLIVPNLDSIEEFRVLTNNFDVQYGNSNGGIVSVITKSGSDVLHGDAFEFFRNSALDARNPFSPERAVFNQNQPGTTLGGPIRPGKVFFFTDYQGTWTTQGLDTGLIPVPSMQDRSGNLSDIASSLTGTVNGQAWANQLSQSLGYRVTVGEPYYTPGCTTSAQCVLPNAVIPGRAWSAPAQRLLAYIPGPNVGADNFSTGANAETVRDHKTALRVDANSPWGLVSGYYHFDNSQLQNPYPSSLGGATVPGFPALTTGRSQLLTVSDTKASANTTNELHVSYMQSTNVVGVPTAGFASLASQGFVTGPGTAGIIALAPQYEGIENVAFNNYTIGEPTLTETQANRTVHLSDSLSRVYRSHTLRFGGDFEYSEVNLNSEATFNGTFSFTGTATGSDFADFLLGVPSSYTQAVGVDPWNLRNKYAGVYAQDTWRARSNLTINYGVRWEFIEPFSEQHNQMSTIVPGEQSVLYPGAPAGLVFPGDPGVPSTLSPARAGNFAPRVGVAYVPSFEHGLMKTIFGDAQQSSLRASFGIFYSGYQGASTEFGYALPPYGVTYVSPAPPLFAQPFVTAATGVNNGQPFPQSFPSTNVSASNPDPNVDWSPIIPLEGDAFFNPSNRPPYSENYMVSFERQLTPKTIVTVNYVGNQNHRLLVAEPANLGNPALCLSVSQPSQVAPGTPTCGPFGEDEVYTTASGQVINGTRGPLGANYGTTESLSAIGFSHYNALELSARYLGSRANLFLGYTYGKSMDNSSNIGEQVNPFNASATLAPSAFDLRHNFVASYSDELPFPELFRQDNVLTRGWTISGVTRLTSGYPVTLYNPTDTSLLGTFSDGVNLHLLDTPNYRSGCPLNSNSNPGNGPAFNPSCFSLPALGQPGNAPRRFFYGPGTVNFDMSLIKNVRVAESRVLQARLEVFNVFNRGQFGIPGSVDGNISSPTFGNIVKAGAPRQIQLALKYNF